MKIIVINGRGGAGKDEFVKNCTYANPNVYSVSTISYVKELAKLIGWNGEKDMKGRRFLSDLKDALSIYNDSPFKRCKEEIKEKIEDYKRINKDMSSLIFFVHAREPIEIQRWVDECNAKSLLIKRKEADEKEFTNHADANVMDFDYHFTYNNDHDLKTLKKDTQAFMDWLLLQEWESKVE